MLLPSVAPVSSCASQAVLVAPLGPVSSAHRVTPSLSAPRVEQPVPSDLPVQASQVSSSGSLGEGRHRSDLATRSERSKLGNLQSNVH